jgi:type II secretory pathway component PulC
MKLLGLVVLLAATVAHADPQTFDVSEADVAWLTELPLQLDEPIGLQVTEDQPRLGLSKGDLVWAIDGASPVSSPFSQRTGPVVYVDVQRGTQRFTRRLVVAAAPHSGHVRRDMLKSGLEMSQSIQAFQQVTAHGKPSGVLVRFPMFDLDGVRSGDVIRAIDRRPIRSPEDAVAALAAAAAGHDPLVIELERLGMPQTVTIGIDDPDQLPADVAELVKRIRQTDRTHYRIPHAVIDKLFENPMAFARQVRIVPAIRNGKPDGFKLYAIRPDSFFAALGFANGDTVETINGNALTSADRALDVYTKLRDAKTFDVTLLRRGKTLRLSYQID